MSFWSTIEETPGQRKASIVFTEGVTFSVNAPADEVFKIITNFPNYKTWNTWSPSFEFPQDEAVRVGSEAIVVAKALKAEFKLPVKVVKLSPSPERYEIAFRGMLTPSWVAVAERVHTVTPSQDGKSCQVKSWESMGGWGSHILKYVMSVPEQLIDFNTKLFNDLKLYAEQQHQMDS